MRVLFGTARLHFRQVEARCGLAGPQLWALFEIERAPGISIRDLGAALIVHQSTTSNLVDRLVKLGVVSKRRGRGDQRMVRLFATPRGRALLARAPAPAVGVLPDALQRLPASTLAGLNTHLDELIATMERRSLRAASTPLASMLGDDGRARRATGPKPVKLARPRGRPSRA